MNITKIAFVILSFVLSACVSNDHIIDMKRSVEGNAVRSIETGNGVRNNIVLKGTGQSGKTLTIPRVQIDGNGWLVAHPFDAGHPVPTKYVASTYIKDGVSMNVDLVLHKTPNSGEWYAIMLHRDVNEDKIFDFGDGITVPDKPVFEDGALVSHRYQTVK